MRFGIGDAVLLPHTPYLRVVVEMTVLMVVDIAAVESEIEFAGTEGVLEIQSHFRLAQRRETPFGLVVGIDIEDGSLAVVHVVAEIEEGIRMTYRAAYISVVVLTRLKARRLREQGMESCRRHDVRREGGVLDRRGFDIGLHDGRFGSNLASRLYHRLEIALDGDAAVESRVGLGESGRCTKYKVQCTKKRYSVIPEYRNTEQVIIHLLHCDPPFLQVVPVCRVRRGGH